MQVMRRQVGPLARLVDDLLDITRISHGQVVLAWDIEPDGRSSAISALTGGKEPFAHCLVGVVKGIRFPRSRLGNKGDDKVKFPFTY